MKAYNRIWDAALWVTMRKYNIKANIVIVFEKLYDQASIAAIHKGSIGDWFRTAVGVRQGCFLSPTLLNIF